MLGIRPCIVKHILNLLRPYIITGQVNNKYAFVGGKNISVNKSVRLGGGIP